MLHEPERASVVGDVDLHYFGDENFDLLLMKDFA
jgi:hypothetical protein